MIPGDIRTNNGLYPQKIRRLLTIVSVLLSLGGFFVLITSRITSLKILLLAILTICMMHLIVLYKNSLNRYEIGIFFFLCIQLISVVRPFGEMDELVATSYLLSYRYGLSSRSFAATLIDMLTGGAFISRYFVWVFIFCSLVFLSFLIAVYLGYIITRSEDSIKIPVVSFSLVYVSCFTSPAAYFVYGNFGRVELFALLFMLIILAVIDKPGFRWIIPFLALFTLGTHLVLLFFYIPFIFILELYEYMGKGNRQKRKLLLFGVTFMVVAAAFFLYLLFHEKAIVFQNSQEFAEYLRARTDINFTEHYIYMTLYAKLQDHITSMYDMMDITYSGHLSILINIPLVVLFIVFWVTCIRSAVPRKGKLFFALPIAMLVYQASAFTLFFDFGRWMILVVTIQFMLVFYLVYAKDETVLGILQNLEPFITRNRYSIILACVLMAFLGPVNPIYPSDKVIHLVKGVLSVFGITGIYE